MVIIILDASHALALWVGFLQRLSYEDSLNLVSHDAETKIEKKNTNAYFFLFIQNL